MLIDSSNRVIFAIEGHAALDRYQGLTLMQKTGFLPLLGHTKDHNEYWHRAWHTGIRVGVWQCKPTV